MRRICDCANRRNCSNRWVVCRPGATHSHTEQNLNMCVRYPAKIMKQQNKAKSLLFPCLAAASIAVALTSCSSPLVGGGGPLAERVFCTLYPNGPTLTNCVGQYYGCFKMTNSTGGTWLTPSNTPSSGTFSNLTDMGTNVKWSMLVTELANLNNHWCTNNSSTMTFPATNSTKYSLYFYINTPTNIPCANPITLQVTWQ